MRNVFRRLRFRKTCRSDELNKQINIAFYLHYFFQFDFTLYKNTLWIFFQVTKLIMK